MAKTRKARILDAAKHEASLAVELYNSARQPRSLEAFFVHMHLAWQFLLHAEFEQNGVDYKYRDSSGRIVRIDGEPRTWELQRCINHRFRPDDPVRQNLENTVKIRNRVEHRWQKEFAIATGGFAQSLILNFESEVCSQFGQQHSMGEILRFPLFVETFTPEGVERIKKALKSLPAGLRRLLASFHADVDERIANDQQYEFRVHLVPQMGPRTDSHISLNFVRENDLTDEQRQALTLLGEAGTVIVRERERLIINSNLMRPNEVARRVNAEIPFKFGLYSSFPRMWKHLDVRPIAGSTNPERTNERYCIYDRAHGDYLYTEAYVKKLVSILRDADAWRTIFGKDPDPKD